MIGACTIEVVISKVLAVRWDYTLWLVAVCCVGV